jgi:hypothetical protein
MVALANDTSKRATANHKGKNNNDKRIHKRRND